MSDFYEDDADRAIQQRKAGTVQVEESRVMSEVKAQVFMARQYPRDTIAAQDRIMAECDRLKLAEKAVYTFPRGGTQVSGPSIRLAECLARAWGNIDAGIIEGERIDGESSMIAYAWDLESNLRLRKEFKVKHSRDTKQGRKALTDERDIYEMTANQGSRRLRSCILGLIPGDVVETAVARCEKTLVAKVGKLEEVIPKMLAKFDEIGVTKVMIEKRLRHRMDATQPAEVVQLGNVFNSIRDGMGTISDYFELDRPPEEVIKPAASKPAEKYEPTAMSSFELWNILSEYREADGLPAQASKEIEEAMRANVEDVEFLTKLVAKVKTAYEGSKNGKR